MLDTLNDRIAKTHALIDSLPTAANGRPLPPKTANRARPAMSSPKGWGWTHYFLLEDDRVVGHKLPGNMSFIADWISERYDGEIIHLGRATPDPLTGEFTFEPWAFPIDFF